MTPELQSYIDQCRAYGMSDAEIRGALKQVGWSDEVIQQALPVPTPQAVSPIAQPTSNPITPVSTSPVSVSTLPEVTLGQSPSSAGKKRKKWPLVSGIVAGVLIFTSGGTVAFAEQGYLPAISKVYRKTSLPLLWQGTNSNAGVSLGEALLSTITTKPITFTTSVDLSTNLAGEASGLTAFLDQGKTPLPHAFADVPSSQVSHLQFSFTTTIGSSDEIAASVSTSFSSSDPIRQLAGGIFNPSFSTLTEDFVIPADGTALYTRTNALPAAQESDKTKWFKIPLGGGNSDVVTNEQNDLKKEITGSSQEQAELVTQVNAHTIDNGIVRHNGKAEAWYTTTVTPAIAKQLSTDAKLSESMQSFFSTLADGWINGKMSFDWYLSPIHPRIDEILLTVAANEQASNPVNGTVDIKAGYDASVPKVTTPSLTQTWKDFDSYIQSIQTAYPNLNSTGAFTSDAIDQLLQWFGSDSGTVNTSIPLMDGSNSSLTN